MTAKIIRVMIVDDDQDLAESLADLLQVHGYEVDIAFMDVRMPVMNGVDSYFAIKKMKPEARIVMMTGFKEPILERAINAGAEGPLHKPFSVEDMLKLVETIH